MLLLRAGVSSTTVAVNKPDIGPPADTSISDLFLYGIPRILKKNTEMRCRRNGRWGVSRLCLVVARHGSLRLVQETLSLYDRVVQLRVGVA